MVGDARYEGAAACDAINELYAVERDLRSFFMAGVRLVEKKRRGRTVTRRYDKPQTPYRRLSESGVLASLAAERSQAHHSGSRAVIHTGASVTEL